MPDPFFLPFMVIFPHCKINLGLHVVSKREDGYHNIETCFYPVPRFDVLEVIPSPDFSFHQSGLSIPGASTDNLCIRAYQLLKNDFQLEPIRIHLHKVIPMGAGLGGGSSDAAHMLKLLNDLFHLNLSAIQLSSYAARLGSDCTFFTQSQPMLGSGRGEILENIAIDLKGYWLCLVKADVHVSTAEAYAGMVPQPPSRSLKEILSLPMENWKLLLVNDFEKTIFNKFPLLNEVKEKLYSFGAAYAAMSGSGSTVFGLFKEKPSLEKQFAGMDYWVGELK